MSTARNNDGVVKPTSIDYTNNPNLSTIEKKILDQYQLMNNTLLEISKELESLTATTKSIQEDDGNDKGVSIRLVENLRQLETKMVFIYTFFKGAVYSILNAQDYTAEQEQQQDIIRHGPDDDNNKQQQQQQEDDGELLGVSDNDTQNLIT